MSQHWILKLLLAATVVVAALSAAALQSQQKMDTINQDRARAMLRDAYDNVKKHYYDPKFHGLDIDTRYHQFDEKIRNAGSLSQSFGVIAGFLDGLNDSHTFFTPPSRPYRVDYGYRMQIYGSACFVSRVRPGTDAESKVHPGDEVLGYNNFAVNRGDFWKMSYYFNGLAPQKASILEVRNPNGQPRNVTVDAKVRELKKVIDLTGQDLGADFWDLIREEENSDHIVRQRWLNVGDVMIWKMPEFYVEDREVDRIFNDARKHKTLILDLRGNHGGAVTTLDRMLGNVFDHDVKIADRIGRKDMKPEIAKTRGSDVFTGKLIVLVDSVSASAAELFPRVVQLEHRGIVVGDQSAGAVMEAKHYPGSQGMDTKIFYGFSITEADLIMKDGKTLEHAGVTPDETILPTPKDLADGSDPVLARAAQIAGLNLDPAAAGKMFPFEWLPN
jgi:C-terminal processing protease CtpA/Prc